MLRISTQRTADSLSLSLIVLIPPLALVGVLQQNGRLRDVALFRSEKCCSRLHSRRERDKAMTLVCGDPPALLRGIYGRLLYSSTSSHVDGYDILRSISYARHKRGRPLPTAVRCMSRELGQWSQLGTVRTVFGAVVSNVEDTRFVCEPPATTRSSSDPLFDGELCKQPKFTCSLKSHRKNGRDSSATAAVCCHLWGDCESLTGCPSETSKVFWGATAGVVRV